MSGFQFRSAEYLFQQPAKEVGFSEVIDCLSIGDLAPTESRGDSGQNCLYDMSIVGNT